MPTCLLRCSARALKQGTSKSVWTKSTIYRHISCSAAPSTSSSSSEIEPPNVQTLAQLAQVGISEQEAAEWGPKIASIVEWFGQLQQVDLEGVPPAVRADVGDANLLRPDQPHDFQNRHVIQVPLFFITLFNTIQRISNSFSLTIPYLQRGDVRTDTREGRSLHQGTQNGSRRSRVENLVLDVPLCTNDN
jgi:aspartyl/glutamyl-tRNA(Asn/Gln) amidotransferase C subunit